MVQRDTRLIDPLCFACDVQRLKEDATLAYALGMDLMIAIHLEEAITMVTKIGNHRYVYVTEFFFHRN